MPSALHVFVVFTVVIRFASQTAISEICNGLAISRPEHSYKLSNCTIVTGQLQIGPSDFQDFTNISFPKLKEVWDLLVIYRIKIVNIGNLFPNLTIIRGRVPLDKYSLIIHSLPEATEIGLQSLRSIDRGLVYIGNCPKLCYYETVNWAALGTSLFVAQGVNSNPCPECSAKCKGGCWTQDRCQNETKPEYCPVYDNGTCVPNCPTNKYILQDINECVTEEDCNEAPSWFKFNNTCTRQCPDRYIIENGSCTYCGDDCKKECKGGDIKSVDGLAKFHKCTHINGHLTLLNLRVSVTSEELQKYLGNIKVIKNFLKIHRSHVKSLEFFKKLHYILGEKLENNNSLLILDNHNLVKLFDWNITNFNISKGNVSIHYNHQLCMSEIRIFAKKIGRSGFNDSEVSPFSNGDQGNCADLDYEISATQINSMNVTLQWDISTADGCFIYYKETGSEGNTGSCADEWKVAVVYTASSSVQITNLKPYTNYTYYLMMNSNSNNPYDRTKRKYFQTLSDSPSKPQNVEALTSNYNAIMLKWEPPLHAKGVLSHYLIGKRKEPLENIYTTERNYCKEPPRFLNIHEKPRKIKVKYTNQSSCNCEEKRESFLMKEDDLKFKNNMETVHAHQFDNYDEYELIQVPADERNYTITDLEPLSLYVFMISVCNKNHTKRQQCSDIVLVYNRTERNRYADDIVDLKVQVTSSYVIASWSAPLKPNSQVLNYLVEYKRTDFENVKSSNCVIDATIHYKMSGFSPGKYALRVRAMTFAGYGTFTAYETFEIRDLTHIIISLSFVIIGTIFTIFLYLLYRWKKKQSHERLHLITSVNPDYAGPIYIEDEWEMERNNIEIHEKLGQGTFGLVYSGFIKSLKVPCAIKSVNEGAQIDVKMEFLNEANVMKAFSDAHHVVRLLGVVSRGKPPLVVMELMANGDLKTFLRRSRGSSHTITSNEMYRMAAEIADGMAYLVAKKFVHRDLAARNCMVSADHTIKIGDFGMARDIYETDYYKKETKGLLPVRWMSPESLADGVFTSDSDVWSYGVVLWEMVTLAEQPYQGLANEQVFQFVIGHGTLERPPECPDILYDVMEVCWKWRPSSRPLFSDIVKKLESHVGQDFKLVSFCHSRDGEEHRIIETERPINPPAMSQVLVGGDVNYSTSEENIDLFNGNQNHPKHFLSFPYQRPHRLSTYTLDGYDISPGYSSYPLSPS